jgi:hypothetical protein
VASLFLSHAGEDREEALALKRALEAGGRHRVFLSSDPETGIAPGAEWEQSVYEALERADAVVALWSPRSEASKWCFAEITHARARKLAVFPVLWQTRSLPTPLVGVQATRHEGDVAAAAADLERGIAGVRRRARMPRLGLLLAVLLVAAGAIAYVVVTAGATRHALVTASSTPSATLLLDGKAVGTTPVAAYRVEPGEHELKLEHPRFHPFVRRVQLGAGGTFELDRPLRALDPGDPEALKAVALASGLELSAVEAVRAGGEPPALLVVFPRGAAREPPSQLLLWGDGSAPTHTLKVERFETDAAPSLLWETSVGRTTGESTLPVPPEVASKLPPGSRWRVRVLSARGSELSVATGSVLDAETRRALEDRLGHLGAGREPDDLLPEFLRADLLIQQGLFADAHALVERLSVALGPRREVGRLMLVLLDRAGLADLPVYEEWLARYEQGR